MNNSGNANGYACRLISASVWGGFWNGGVPFSKPGGRIIDSVPCILSGARDGINFHTITMKHPIKSDSRYSIALEFTGHLSGKPRHVLRFAGERIADYGNCSAAVVRAVGHKAARDGALIVTEITINHK